MSDYYQSLEAPTKGRYLDKLWLLGLDEDGDPYTAHNEERFIDDMLLWPRQVRTHFLLLHRPPSVYTKHQLLQWKSLKAYNHLSGHVRTIKLWVLSSASSCILKATVNPSQHSPEDPHSA